MENTNMFKTKLRQGDVCLGIGITFTDATVTEAVCSIADFVWIDAEHNALSLETVQAHIMATKGSDTTPLVRVPWNDPVLIKPVLDIGAAGVIVPLIRKADDVRQAVAACRYPPDGIRGFGPRRPSNYSRLGGPEFCQAANEAIITIVQIEHIDAVNNLDEILTVPGLTSVVVGPNDLAGSMGHMGQPDHPEVLTAIERVITTTRRTEVFVGIATGGEPEKLVEWINKGIQWMAVGTDFSFLVRSADQVIGPIRDGVRTAG